MRELVISKYEAGQRFDKFLAKYMELAPKSFFYKMMRKKNITLNGKKAAGNEKLMEKLGIAYRSCSHVGTVVHLSLIHI